MNELRLSVRALLRRPGFCAVVVFTLALGVGANTAVFSVINTTFLRALPYPEPDQLIHLEERNADGTMSVSYPDFQDWRAQQDAFAAMALYKVMGQKLRARDTEAVKLVPTSLVTADFFKVLGVSPARGRPLLEADDQTGAAPVTWLSDAGWDKHFGRDPSILGRVVSLNDRAVTVVGVLPPTFRFHREADFYLPLAPFVAEQFMQMRENHNDAHGLARLKPGVALSAARTQLEVVARRLEQEHPGSNAGVGAEATRLAEHLGSWARGRLVLLLAAVGLVLLIASVNVANMLLVRSLARQREMALRVALGASRWQVMRPVILEGALLAALGGVVGLLLADWGCRGLETLVPWQLRTLHGNAGVLDIRVFAFAFVVATASGLGAALVPAWRLSRTAPGDALKSTAGSLSPWRWARLHAGEGFVVIQMSLALVLLIGAGLMIRSLQQLADVSPGFQPQHVLTAETAAPTSLARDNPLALAPHFESLLEAARQVPGVDAAAIGTSIPFTWSVSTMVFYRDDRPVPTDGQFPHGNSHFVTADYFKVLGIPLQRGRLLTGREPQPPLQPGTALSPENFSQVYQGLVLDCVISQSMADRYWPHEDPLGKQFRLGYPHMRMPPARIVGVVGSTVQEGLDRERPEEFYLSLRQMPFPFGVHVIVRTHGEPSSLIPMLRSALEAASKNEPVHDIQPLQSRIDASVSDRRFTAQLFGAFSAVALALACVGIHGVLSFIVGQRTREVGVRMALGAPRSCILRQVVARGLRLVVVGSVLGLAAAWAFARFLQHQLFGVGTLDPWSYTLSASLLLAGALLASFLPAHRAARLDPVRALRTE